MSKEQKQHNDFLKMQHQGISEESILKINKIVEVIHDFHINSIANGTNKTIRELYNRQIKSIEKCLFIFSSESNINDINFTNIDDSKVTQLLIESLPAGYDRLGISFKFSQSKHEMLTKHSQFDFSEMIFFFSKLNSGKWELKFAKKIVGKLWQLSLYRVILSNDFLDQYLDHNVIEITIESGLCGQESLIPEYENVMLDVKRAVNALLGFLDEQRNPIHNQIYNSKLKILKAERQVNILTMK